LAAELRAKAAALGIAALGFASATPMEAARQEIEKRKAAGLHAGMQFTYRSPERSTDPRRALPGAVSLVVGAWPYGPAAAESERSGTSFASREQRADWRPLATVARFGRIDHYADLRVALGGLASVLDGYGWRARVLVDDNALVDRAAAHQAGLGWFGKNCNILLPGRGSWFLLGSVVTDAPLPTGKPVTDGCGGCRRCHVACPTGALIGPGVLDARKCLAWLLQAPGPFPFEFREVLGDRIYGCDDCQSCCPVNKKALRASARETCAGAGALSRFARPEDESQVDVLEILSATDDELLQRYGRWYVPRRDPRYLRRNALVVLGNVGLPQDAAVEAALLRYLQHDDELLRSHAVWAALRLGRADLVDATQVGRPEPSPLVRQEIERRQLVRPRASGPAGDVQQPVKPLSDPPCSFGARAAVLIDGQ
jgi:epoxyqueuosine reductase